MLHTTKLLFSRRGTALLATGVIISSVGVALCENVEITDQKANKKVINNRDNSEPQQKSQTPHPARALQPAQEWVVPTSPSNHPPTSTPGSGVTLSSAHVASPHANSDHPSKLITSVKIDAPTPVTPSSPIHHTKQNQQQSNDNPDTPALREPSTSTPTNTSKPQYDPLGIKPALAPVREMIEGKMQDVAENYQDLKHSAQAKAVEVGQEAQVYGREATRFLELALPAVGVVAASALPLVFVKKHPVKSIAASGVLGFYAFTWLYPQTTDRLARRTLTGYVSLFSPRSNTPASSPPSASSNSANSSTKAS